MGYGNAAVSNNIIWLDSDGEYDWAQPPPSDAAIPNSSSSHTAQATLLPGPKVLTVPISSSLNPAHPGPGGSTGHATQGGFATRGVFDAALSQLTEVLRQREVAGGERNTNETPSFFSSSNSGPATGPIPVPQVGGMGMRPQTSHTPGLNPVYFHADPGQHLTAHHSGQPPPYSGQPAMYLGQSGPNSYDTNRQFTTIPRSQPSSDSAASTSRLQLSPTFTSLLNTTTNNNVAPSPVQQYSDLPLPSSSLPDHATQALSILASAALRDQARTLHQPAPTQTTSAALQHSRPPEAAASQSVLDMMGSPPHPLFSPPKLPLHRETGVSIDSCVTRSPAAVQTVFNSQPPFSSPPHSVQAGPSPPSASPFPCSTPSPLSQPPTPSTSIPLLSPVAAHLFQVSMSKSPKPTPSPSHTPSPSPSSNPHPPLSSPPSVPLATPPAVAKNRPTPLLT